MLMDFRFAGDLGKRRARLQVEALEERAFPAGPSFASLNVAQLSDGRVRVSGTVTDDHPDLMTVRLGGVVNATTYTYAGGSFLWEGNASGLGTITADTTDYQNLAAPTASATIANNAPSIALTVTPMGTGTNVTITGTVTDETPGSRTVNLGGQVNATVVTMPDGTFSWTGPASGLGAVTATTTDVWGMASNTAQAVIAASAPVISNFTAVVQPGTTGRWLFKGQVTVNSASATGLTVRFGGLPSLATQPPITVQSDGWFYLYVNLAPGEDGTAWCQTTDAWGQDSNQATFLVRQS
jgi:hypothetical protein